MRNLRQRKMTSVSKLYILAALVTEAQPLAQPRNLMEAVLFCHSQVTVMRMEL